MTNEQLDLALGIPLLSVIVSIAVNVALYIHLAGRVEKIGDNLYDRMDRLGESLNAKLDVLTGKVIDIDNRVVRIETKLGIG